MKKWLCLFSVILLSIVMVGCSEAKADLSEYPENVKNGEVSPKFYDNVEKFINKYQEVYDGVFEIHEAEEIYADIILEESYVDAIVELEELSNEAKKHSSIKGLSKKEKEIETLAANIIKFQENYNEKLWDKASNAKYEDETDLWVSRSMLEAVFEQLKEEIEYVE